MLLDKTDRREDKTQLAAKLALLLAVPAHSLSTPWLEVKLMVNSRASVNGNGGNKRSGDGGSGGDGGGSGGNIIGGDESGN